MPHGPSRAWLGANATPEPIIMQRRLLLSAFAATLAGPALAQGFTEAQRAEILAILRDALKRVSQQLEAAEARNTNERRDAAAEKARLQVGVCCSVVCCSVECCLLHVVALSVACCLLPLVLDEKEAAEKHLSCDACCVWLAA